jgi:hypothetical protein
MAYVKYRECVKCKKIELVRKDSKSIQCKSCASSAAGKKAAIIKKSKVMRNPCKHCGELVKSSKAQFCSLKCKSEHSRIDRQCKQCNKIFSINKSVLKTNASGNFCSRPCYEKFMCNGERTTGRGSQWNKIRKEVLADFPFCAVCGTTKQLQVHHITPFRISHDNSKDNLVPLCVKHHKWIEMMFVDTERFGVSAETEIIWKNMIRARQSVTAYIIKGILNAAA